MYNAKFVSSKGDEFVFSADNNVVFDIKDMGGIPVNIGTGQSSSQIGQSVITKSVSGTTLLLNGVIFNNIVPIKDAIRKIFAPFTYGDLYIDDYKIRVHTKTSPLFKPQKNDGRFSLQLFAPVPFFSKQNESVFSNRVLTKLFSFPVNYSEPHKFGVQSESSYIEVVNGGDIKTPFKAEISTITTISNFQLIDVDTQRKLKFNGELTVGEVLEIYKDDDGYLRVTITSENGTEDAMSMLDDESDLFELDVGITVLATQTEGTGTMVATVYFNEMVGAMYEH